MKKNNVPDYVKKSKNYKSKSGVKKINVWIGVFYIAILTSVIVTANFPYGKSNLLWDIIHYVTQLVIAYSGIYVLWKIHVRDEMIYENETITNLIYYKEHMKKQKSFPVSATLLIVYTMTMLAMLFIYSVIFYKIHIG